MQMMNLLDGLNLRYLKFEIAYLDATPSHHRFNS